MNNRMKWARVLLMSALLLLLTMPLALAKVSILCYHEVDRENDNYAVKLSQFRSHIDYLRENGYRFINLDEYIAYTKGELTLPEKTVMITFDDGYRSFYTKIYPILKEYQIPALYAIVTSWTDGEGKPTDVRALASWDELREMEGSGLVTVASHSHAMHKQQAIDPQGDRNGIAGSHLYFSGRYETDAEYQERLYDDMAETQRIFEEKLGHPSRALVWPYGIYSAVSVKAALDNGMEATFLLSGGINEATERDRLRAKRMIMSRATDVKRLDKLLNVDHDAWDGTPIRMSQVDIDAVYDKDPAVFRQNLSTLTDQLTANNISVVALQAFADTDGDGNVDKVYFHNDVIPVEVDAFNAVGNAILQQGIDVVAWMPSLTYQPFVKADGSNLVTSKGEKGWYRRISPFDQDAVNQAAELFRELAKYTPAEGILFQDDLYLNDHEDYSAYGKAAYEEAFGTPLDALQKDDTEQMQKWTRLKTKRLTEVSQQLAAAFKENRPDAILMRDIYDETVVNPMSAEWFAQSYTDCLANYDYTVIMAYPYMDKEEEPLEYLKKVAAAVKAAGGNKKTIVKIQSYDWDKERWIGQDVFTDQMDTLKESGIRNIAYYPSTFYKWEKWPATISDED